MSSYYTHTCNSQRKTGILVFSNSGRLPWSTVSPRDPWKSFREFLQPFEILCWMEGIERGVIAYIIFSQWYMCPRKLRSGGSNSGLGNKRGDALPVVPWHVGYYVIKARVCFSQAFNCRGKVPAVLRMWQSISNTGFVRSLPVTLLTWTEITEPFLPFEYWLFPSSYTYSPSHFKK